ncbi:MAG: PQQ-binding-like beta-propeller repeat protein [Holosporaceae bacterium]|jgi:outer membrane protein assembly factor BamB|nr:PQQ-binding-like beta-propeller repeat protein [Holosporaceae bacterium]
MKRLLASPFLLGLFFLVGCSSKEPLPGTREELVIAEMREGKIADELDSSPVIPEPEKNNSECPQAFFNASHCYPPLKFSLSPLEVWSSDLDFESSKSVIMTAAPVIADGKIFCIDAGGIVYALDRKTGERLWRMSTTIIGKDGQIGGAIAYDNGRLIVTSSFSECFALDAKSGEILWRIKLPAACKGDGITVSSGKAFISCSNSSLQAVDVNSGKILWSHSGMVSDATYIGNSGAAVVDGVVYLTYPSGEVYALLEETGAVIWDAMMSKFSLTNVSRAFAHPRACPIVKDGIVYISAANAQTSAFDVKTGKPIWKSDFGSVQTPIVSGNSIFIFNARSELVCLNKENGKKRWSRQLTSDEEHISDWHGMLLLKDNLLVISPRGRLMFVSIYDGKIVRTTDIEDGGDGISVNPAIADGTMYLLMNEGKILAYR